jgi:hypothetical protein
MLDDGGFDLKVCVIFFIFTTAASQWKPDAFSPGLKTVKT